MTFNLEWPVNRLFEAIRRPRGRRWLNLIPGDGSLMRALDDRFRDLKWRAPKDVGEFEYRWKGDPFDVAIGAPYMTDRRNPKHVKPIPHWPGYYASPDGDIYRDSLRGAGRAPVRVKECSPGKVRIWRLDLKKHAVTRDVMELAATVHPLRSPEGLAAEVDHAVQVGLRLAPQVLFLLPLAWMCEPHRAGWLSETAPATIFVLPDKLRTEACAWMHWKRERGPSSRFKMLGTTPSSERGEP